MRHKLFPVFLALVIAASGFIGLIGPDNGALK